MKSLILTTGALFAAAALPAQLVVLQTAFTSAGSENVTFTNTNDATQNGAKGVGIVINDLAYSGGWGTASLTSLDMGGGYSWSSANLGNKRMFTTLGDGSYQMLNNASPPSTVNSNRIVVTSGDQFVGLNSGQVGLSTNGYPLNHAVMNLVFSVDNTFTAPGLEISFRAGNIATNGTWYNATEAQNGFWQVRISPITMVGTAGTVNYGAGFDFGAPLSVPAGAGPTVSGSASQSLTAGTYLLQIILSNQTYAQRPGIDDLTITAVPEPAAYAALFGLLALGGLAWRRKR